MSAVHRASSSNRVIRPQHGTWSAIICAAFAERPPSWQPTAILSSDGLVNLAFTSSRKFSLGVIPAAKHIRSEESETIKIIVVSVVRGLDFLQEIVVGKTGKAPRRVAANCVWSYNGGRVQGSTIVNVCTVQEYRIVAHHLGPYT